MTEYTDYNKIMNALRSQKGKCLDDQAWEYFGVAKAICDALGVPYPKWADSFSKNPDDMDDKEFNAYEAWGVAMSVIYGQETSESL